MFCSVRSIGTEVQNNATSLLRSETRYERVPGDEKVESEVTTARAIERCWVGDTGSYLAEFFSLALQSSRTIGVSRSREAA